MDSADYRSRYNGAAVFIFIHIIALFTGFTVLAAVFEFPGVLRESAQYRLYLYRQGQAVIQPVYWILAMTGFSQIAISVFLYRSFRSHSRTLLKFAVLFGVLAGILQTMGFIRWAILIPWLAERIAAPGVSAQTVETIGLIEGAFNRYAGMALGGHTANICLGLWTFLTGAAVFGDRLFDRKLGWFGAGVGLVAMLPALEQLGIAPAVFEVIVEYGFPAWAVWLMVIAVSLLKTDPENGRGPSYGWKSFTWSASLYVLMILPNLLG
ncbi:MAG: DUF4386 domain-containing protein [Candidatus Glassbacteria bacterium]|nr:DUF4386 domain-containing protein [Candidatus Glassbacteria bacterium]